jgi:hypothetical protein
MSMLRLKSHSNRLGLSPRRRKAPGAAFPTVVQDGLLAEWRFDDGAGTTLTDYSGNGHDGTLGADGAAPTWTAEGLSFDGGDIVAVPSFNPSSAEITVWVVIKQPTLPSTDEFFFCSGDFIGDGISYFMSFGQGGHTFRAAASDDGTLDAGHNIDKENVATDWADGAWHALAFTYSGSELKLYGDGALLSFSGGGTASGLFNITENVIIGALLVGTPIAPFSGSIAYITINEIVMDGDQLAAQYAALAAIMAARGITLP